MECITFGFPLPRTHCGVTLGNGNFGVLVWGKDRLCITVNRADFWDHRGGELIQPGTTYRNLVQVAQQEGTGYALEKAIPRESFPPDVFKPQRLPVGRFEFSFAEDAVPAQAILGLRNGRLTVTLSNGKNLLIDICLDRAVLFVHDPSSAIHSVECKPSWEFPHAREWLQRYGFQPPHRRENGWVQSCPADPSLACVCQTCADGYALSLELGNDNEDAWSQAGALIQRSTAEISRLLSETASWWNAYWNDVPKIHLPDKWFERFYYYALYKFAAATHPDGYACALQGPWQEEYKKAEWSGDYHFNVNVQQIYSLAFPTGRLEHLLPLFDMIESEPFMHALRHNAKVMFGIDDGLWFTHAVDDRGQQCGWLIPGSVLDPACGAWTAKLYWDYYQYSCDLDFLRERALPFLKGVMRGYMCMMEEYEGRLSIPLAISAEYGCSNPRVGHGGRDPSYQLAAAHMLADYLIEAARVLGETPDPMWIDIRKRLPKFCVVEANDESGNPEKRIAVWEGQDLDVCHRHHSHLACIYPFQTLTSPTPSELEILENSLDQWVLMGMGQWSEWCMPWAAILQTRLGLSEAPMVLLNLWKEIFVNEGLATVYLPRSRGIIAHRRNDLKKPKETHEIMQLDGTMGAATALLEMLAHQRGETAHLFAGVPDAWQDVSFYGIWLPGGFRLCAERGKVVSVYSQKGGTLRVCADGREHIFILRADESVTVAWPDFGI